MDQQLHPHHHHALHTYEAPADEVQDLPLEDDEPILPRKRSLEGAEMDMTPMIDITFLLLIFFLVASKIAVQGEVSLPQAKHGRAVSMEKAAVIVVRETGGEEGRPDIFLGDSTEAAAKCKATDPDDQAEEIASYVEDKMRKEQKTFVVIKASRGVKAREVQRVAEAVGQAETVEALHVAVLEKN